MTRPKSCASEIAASRTIPPTHQDRLHSYSKPNNGHTTVSATFALLFSLNWDVWRVRFLCSCIVRKHTYTAQMTNGPVVASVPVCMLCWPTGNAYVWVVCAWTIVWHNGQSSLLNTFWRTYTTCRPRFLRGDTRRRKSVCVRVDLIVCKWWVNQIVPSGSVCVCVCFSFLMYSHCGITCNAWNYLPNSRNTHTKKTT